MGTSQVQEAEDPPFLEQDDLGMEDALVYSQVTP